MNKSGHCSKTVYSPCRECSKTVHCTLSQKGRTDAIHPYESPKALSHARAAPRKGVLPRIRPLVRRRVTGFSLLVRPYEVSAPRKEVAMSKSPAVSRRARSPSRKPKLIPVEGATVDQRVSLFNRAVRTKVWPLSPWHDTMVAIEDAINVDGFRSDIFEPDGMPITVTVDDVEYLRTATDAEAHESKINFHHDDRTFDARADLHASVSQALRDMAGECIAAAERVEALKGGEKRLRMVVLGEGRNIIGLGHMVSINEIPALAVQREDLRLAFLPGCDTLANAEKRIGGAL